MSLIFRDIGYYRMDAIDYEQSIKTWITGHGRYYSQIFNYLESVKQNVIMSSTKPGLIEITFKSKPKDRIFHWWNDLTKAQQLLIKQNPLLISISHEFWPNQFKPIENFCDSINKKYEDVAVAVSNFNPEFQDNTKLKVIDTSAGFLKWYSKIWFEKAYSSIDKEEEYPIKKYICTCGRPRKSRLEVVNFLAKYDLIDKGLVSFGVGSSTYGGKSYKGPVGIDLIEEMMQEWNIKNNYLKNYVPLIIDNTLKQVNWSKYVDMELVIESFAENDLDTQNELVATFANVPFTEKTLRPIYNCQPFLVLGTNIGIEYEKQLGYYVFDEFHDNTPEGIVLALNELLKIDLKNYKQQEIKNNKELFMYHSTNDFDNIYNKIKQWLA